MNYKHFSNMYTLIFYQFKDGTKAVMIREADYHYSTAKHEIPAGTKYMGMKKVEKIDLIIGPLYI